MNIPKSISLFQEAQTLLPGGVDSPVRAFRAVGGQPLFVDCGEGPYLYDVDGNRYIDYVLSWGPLITGHAHPQVVEAEPAPRKERRQRPEPAEEPEPALAEELDELEPEITTSPPPAPPAPRPAPRIERRVERVEWSAEEFEGELADRVRRPMRSDRETTAEAEGGDEDEDAEAA